MQITNTIDRAIFLLGRYSAFLLLLLVIAVCCVLFLRDVYKISIMALQEACTYIYALLFMLGVAYTLQTDEHVRVDVFYHRFSSRTRAWVNALGHILLLIPSCIVIIVLSTDFVVSSWKILEKSAEPGGIPAVFLLKSLIPLMAISLLLQSASELIKQSVFLTTGRHLNRNNTDFE